ncbi:CHAP domain-containing protein [Maridesulfovibrio sp.]|uniref:CHAP domain-containing protein n=1 Tax=Maridesulfovibrio sp. TaxID=2795000 RepID=UPI0039EEFB18
MKSFSFVFTVLICGLLLSSVAFAKEEVENSTKKYGGQCVSYVRTLLGGDRTKMPGLCKFAKDCGAYRIWDHWDFGYGKGKIPKLNSVMVLAPYRGNKYGHCAVVIKIESNKGKTVLTVSESNKKGKGLISNNARYWFYPKKMWLRSTSYSAYRQVLGFVYTSNSD